MKKYKNKVKQYIEFIVVFLVVGFICLYLMYEGQLHIYNLLFAFTFGYYGLKYIRLENLE